MIFNLIFKEKDDFNNGNKPNKISKCNKALMIFIEILFYPQLKILMDILFYTFFVICALFVFPLGLTFAAFSMFYPFFLISKSTRKMGKLTLEFCAFILMMFFFKFAFIVMFLPLIFYNYIKTFVKICKEIITPENDFMINFKLLLEDYKYYGFVLMSIISYAKKEENEE